jgi:putative chitobiose transport system substrate-binding protein
MRNHRMIALLAVVSLVFGACSAATPTAVPGTQAPLPTPITVVITAPPVTQPTPITVFVTPPPETAAPSPTEVAVGPSPSPAPPCAADADTTQKDPVVAGVEPNATITFWTFYLHPTFDPFIQCTIARFQAAYPGVTVKWEDHQASFLDDYRLAVSSGTQPDVANLSNNAGWVREFAQAGKLLPLSDETDPTKPAPLNGTDSILGQYFPNLLYNNTVGGKNYQLPWYQAIAVELINKKIFDAAGVDPATFPKTIAGLPDLCTAIAKTSGTVCDIRLTVDDYLSQMAYEGGVKILSDDGKAFTFASPEAAKWVQMYADMVKATPPTVDTDALTSSNDRVALLLFSAGQAAFYQTGPQLIRVVKENNPDLYSNLQLAPLPLGASGVSQPDSQGIAVKKDTKFPNASIALAAFFSGPRAMLDFAKIVPIYPSTPAAYDDPFFSTPGSAVEDSVRPLAKTIIANERSIVPDIPQAKDVNELVKTAVESVLFGTADALTALTDAQTKANDLLAHPPAASPSP